LSCSDIEGTRLFQVFLGPHSNTNFGQIQYTYKLIHQFTHMRLSISPISHQCMYVILRYLCTPSYRGRNTKTSYRLVFHIILISMFLHWPPSCGICLSLQRCHQISQ
jgi:hypothetical protein